MGHAVSYLISLNGDPNDEILNELKPQSWEAISPVMVLFTSETIELNYFFLTYLM
jgi:hypothetical protein